jgi:hypothetical protein
MCFSINWEHTNISEGFDGSFSYSCIEQRKQIAELAFEESVQELIRTGELVRSYL